VLSNSLAFLLLVYKARHSWLVGNFGLDKVRQQRQRFLPAEVASLSWYGRRHPFLRDVQFGSAEYLPQRDRRLHFSGQVRIVEFVSVADALAGRQFMISSAERVALAGAEISERHLVSAADFRIQVMDLTRESIRRKPFGQCVRIEERPINSLRRRPEHTVELDSLYFVRHHNFLGLGFHCYDEGSGRFRTSVAQESARRIADLAADPSDAAASPR
jgi:hypothetical protein